jgi:hypothetical protein
VAGGQVLGQIHGPKSLFGRVFRAALEGGFDIRLQFRIPKPFSIAYSAWIPSAVGGILGKGSGPLAYFMTLRALPERRISDMRLTNPHMASAAR